MSPVLSRVAVVFIISGIFFPYLPDVTGRKVGVSDYFSETICIFKASRIGPFEMNIFLGSQNASSGRRELTRR